MLLKFYSVFMIAGTARRTVHTHQLFKIKVPNTDQAHYKQQ